MKLTITQAFVDRFTLERHEPGDLLEVPDIRGMEIIQRGFATEVMEETEEKPKRSKMK